MKKETEVTRLKNNVPKYLQSNFWHYIMGVYFPSLMRMKPLGVYIISDFGQNELLNTHKGVYRVISDQSIKYNYNFTLQRHDFPNCSGAKESEIDRFADRFRIQHQLYTPKKTQTGLLVLDSHEDSRFKSPFPHEHEANKSLFDLSEELRKSEEVEHIRTKNYLITELCEKVSSARKILSQTNSLLTFYPFALPKTTWVDFSDNRKLLKYFRQFAYINQRRVRRKEIISSLPTIEEITDRFR